MTMTVEVFSSRKKKKKIFFLSFFFVLTTEAATGRVLQKMLFLKISHSLQENACIGDSNTRVFLRILQKKTYFVEHLQTAASVTKALIAS